MTIPIGTTLTIDGNLTLEKKTDIINEGVLAVTGNYTNNGNGATTVQNGGQLDVGDFSTGIGDFINGGQGVINFIDGTINIAGNFVNSGNGDIESGALVTVGGDFDISGNSSLNVSGGLNIGGDLNYSASGGNISVESGGVIQATTINSTNNIDVEDGGTIYATSGNINAPSVNTNGNTDGDCTNGCCGANCNTTGDALNETGQGILPVELVDFRIENSAYDVDLIWSTASEENTSHFELYKSYNGQEFFYLDQVPATGFSSSLQTYKYKDTNPWEGFNFYKLVSVDYDGYTEVFEVILNDFHFAGLQPYPNPFDGQNLSLSSFEAIGELDVIVTDLMGRVVLQTELKDGNYAIEFAQPLKKGFYMLKVKNEKSNYNYSTRLIVK